MTINDKEFTAENIIWEDVPCNFCGQRQDKHIFIGPDRLANLPGEFNVVQCTNCGLIRQNPRPVWESLKHYYQDDYVSHTLIIDDEPSMIKRWDRRWGMHKLIRAVEKRQPTGKLLDIGAGTGIFLAEALRQGKWEVMGLEPSDHAAEYARNRLNIPIVETTFPTDELPEGLQFDVITMWHVVEHLADPKTSFEQINHLLAPGGWFIFTIPNNASLDKRIFRDYWVGWDLPRHLFTFPHDTLTQMLEQSNMDVRDMQCLATTYALLRHDLEFWVQDWHQKNSFWANLLLKIYNNVIVRALLILPFWLLGKLKKAPVITIFAQKRS